LLFSLFLQEINSDAPADLRKNPRLFAPSPSKEQRDEERFFPSIRPSSSTISTLPIEHNYANLSIGEIA
jgi:hypothetical protein